MNTYWTTELKLTGTGMALLGGAVSGAVLALAVVGQVAIGPALWLPLLIGLGLAMVLYTPTLIAGTRGTLTEACEMVAYSLSLIAWGPAAMAVAALLTLLAIR